VRKRGKLSYGEVPLPCKRYQPPEAKETTHSVKKKHQLKDALREIDGWGSVRKTRETTSECHAECDRGKLDTYQVALKAASLWTEGGWGMCVEAQRRKSGTVIDVDKISSNSKARGFRWRKNQGMKSYWTANMKRIELKRKPIDKEKHTERS